VNKLITESRPGDVESFAAALFYLILFGSHRCSALTAVRPQLLQIYNSSCTLPSHKCRLLTMRAPTAGPRDRSECTCARQDQFAPHTWDKYGYSEKT